MRAWARSLLVLVIVASAGTVSAASRKPSKHGHVDLFAAMNKAAHARSHKSGRHAKASKKAARREAREARPAKSSLVAEAAPAPAPKPTGDVLILTDYAAPGRHALVGP